MSVTKPRFSAHHFLVLLAFLSISHCFFSQEKRTIHGVVTDAASGEKIVGATVYDTLHRLGATTNEYGFYSITVPGTAVVLKFAAYGMTPVFLRRFP